MYNKCVILLSKWVTLNAAPCITPVHNSARRTGHNNEYSLSVSVNMDGVRNLLTATNQFTWLELPTQEPDTGSLTMAGWIQLIQPLMWKLNFCDWATHCLYFVLRGVTSDGKPFFYNAWFPLDTDDTPTYMLVLIIQVTSASSHVLAGFLRTVKALLHNFSVI